MDLFVLGEMGTPSLEFGLAARWCAAVVATVVLLGKEMLYYCFDPVMAEASGAAGFIHYLLMMLVTITIVIGVRVAGALLVTARC